MNWINSCKLIISGDSLGLHLAFALKKKAIGLFGSTSPKEVFFYGNSDFVQAGDVCQSQPCYNPECDTGVNCIDNIDLNEIIEKTEILLKK